MVSGVIGSIPCGHSPASSGQTKQWPVTAKLQAIKHWSQWTLALTWFLFLLLFSMRTHLALHIHSALLYRWEQILKPLFKTFCYSFTLIALLWLFVCLFLHYSLIAQAWPDDVGVSHCKWVCFKGESRRPLCFGEFVMWWWCYCPVWMGGDYSYVFVLIHK